MSQCLGRRVKDNPKGLYKLPFENGEGYFHLPLRCEMITRSEDLCDSCLIREQKTNEKVKAARKTTIDGSHPSYLMGRVTDPIPFWSRLYDGAWYHLKIKDGCTISEDSMVKIKKAVEKAYGGITTVEPQPITTVRKKKTVVVQQSVAPLTEVLPVPAPVVPKKRIAVKKTAGVIMEPVARVSDTPVNISENTIIHVKVRKQEVDGRMFYLDPKKDKLYDMKFKYMGRLRDGAIVPHPDSDADV